MGWLRFLEAGRQVDCMRNIGNAHPIPILVEQVQNTSISFFGHAFGIFLSSQARKPPTNDNLFRGEDKGRKSFINCSTSKGFAKKKDACFHLPFLYFSNSKKVFQRLANDGFCEKNHCIVLSGRGYPDVSTRRFLRLLVDELNLPAYGLVDSDPYGLDILTTYRFGSMRMAYDASTLSTPKIRWLGVFPSDCDTFHIPDRCLLPMTDRDNKKVETMLKRCYLWNHAPKWRQELHMMWTKGIKFEIEAISCSSFSLLSDQYIPYKIKDGLYI